MLARSLLSGRKKQSHKTSVSEPRTAACTRTNSLPGCCLLFAAGKKPQADRGVFTLQSRRRRPGPTQPNPTEASGMGKPSDLFLGDVVSSLLLSLTQLRSFFWGVEKQRNDANTNYRLFWKRAAAHEAHTRKEERVCKQSQCQCCVGSAQSYFQAMKPFVSINIRVFL